MNFQCGKCGSLMDVEDQFLGQPVRCPHCQQVVQTRAPLSPSAPPPPGELPPEITFIVPAAGEAESIFEGPEHAGDDLFGSAPGPKIEMPSEERALSPSPEAPSAESIFSSAQPGEGLFSSAEMPRLEASPRLPVQPLFEMPPTEALAFPAGTQRAPENAAGDNSPTLTGLEQASSAGDVPADIVSSPFHRPPAEQAPSDSGPSADLTGFGPPVDEGLAATAIDSAVALAPGSFPTNLPRRAVPAGMRGGLFIALVLIPLISYSLFATIAVLILYLRPPQPSLEYLPDVDGDLRGAKRQKRTSVSYERLDPDSPLPDRLKVALRHSIRLGDVEVTPERIELTHLTIRHPDLSVDPLPGEALVLHLGLKNVSQDVVFSPTDPYFDRLWNSSQDSKPYTFLEVGEHRCYGGPLPWSPGRHPENWPVIAGQAYQVLQPGEHISTLVCTSPGDVACKPAASYQGPLLWRVQLRRGLVRVGDRDVPATGVVGVQFNAADIKRPQS